MKKKCSTLKSTIEFIKNSKQDNVKNNGTMTIIFNDRSLLPIVCCHFYDSDHCVNPKKF